jgi:hypothetical protein
VSGVKSALNGVDVVHITIPQFPSLTTEALVIFAKSRNSQLGHYLPSEEKEWAHLPKAFIANLIYAHLGEAFK